MATIDLSDRPYHECPDCGRGVVTAIASYCSHCERPMELHRPTHDRTR